MKRGRNLFWGLFFIFLALLIILNQLGMLGQINIISLLISILMLPLIISGIRHRNMSGILFPIAIILILYSKPLGLEKFSPLPILGVALFLSIGLSFFIKPKPYFFESKHIKEMGEDVKEQSEDGIINISTKLSSSIKYIDIDNLKKVNIYCSCSGSKVYFDSAKMNGNEAIVNIEASCSGIELFIPKKWRVENQLNCVISGVEEKGRKIEEDNQKKLILKGKVSFSGITIIYI